MTDIKQLTSSEFVELLVHQGYDNDGVRRVVEQVGNWLVRGDAVLVYVNADLSHPDVGDRVFLSWGSSSAMVDRSVHQEPPITCPVELAGAGKMSWRYQLDAVYVDDYLANVNERAAAASFDERFDAGVARAVENGHDMHPDSAASARRSSCKVCGRAVLQAFGGDGHVYGSAIGYRCAPGLPS